jgi:hypothetical protein
MPAWLRHGMQPRSYSSIDITRSCLYNSDVRREEDMFRGFVTVGVFIVVMALVGAVVGVLVGALADNYLLWVAVMAALGSGVGLALGYGMLPEK